MAFDVTPTSGAAPYTLTAEFANKYLIDNVNFAVEFRASIQPSACNTEISSGDNQPTSAQLLLNDGSYVASGTVDPGLCRTYSLIIRDLVNNTVLEFANVYVNNI